MTDHEFSTKSTPETDASISEETTEVEGKEPLVFGYSPAELGSLSAHQMEAIEDQAWRDIGSGFTPEEVQARVYNAMTNLGLDLSKAQDNGLVVKFESVDGKMDVRAINLSATDFGTRIAKAKLEALPAQPLEKDVTSETEDDPTEEDAEAERAIEAIKAEIEQTKGMLVNSLEQSAGQGAQVERALSDVYEAGRHLIRKMENREDLRSILSQAEGAIAAARTRVRGYVGSIDDTKRYGRATAANLEQALKLAGNAGSSAEDFARSSKMSLDVLEGLWRVQGRANEDNAIATQALTRLDNLINEMQHSRYGVGVYESELRTILSKVGGAAEGVRPARNGLSNAAIAFRSIQR